MAYVPGCSADVFISYAHRDNQDGWVARLKKRLTEKLNPFLAPPPEVWFDDRLHPGVYFKDEIQAKIKNSPIFVAVVSPAYLKSEFSIGHELDCFLNNGGKDVIQLVKVPLEEGQEIPAPEAQYKVLHDSRDGYPFEGEALEKILDDVVAAIRKRLREEWEKRPKIYVAQIRDEPSKQRWDELKERLHAEGYATLPNGTLPLRVPDARIRRDLEEASLSVHLEGLRADAFAQRQLELARQTGHPALTLPRLPAKDQFSAIVADVQTQIAAGRKPAVYLIYDYYSDRARVAALPEFIRLKTGCEVFEPVAGETYHKFRLQISDGLLIFRGEAPEEWLQSQEQSLLQAAARRGERRAAEAKYFTRNANGHPAGVQVKRGTRREWIIERTGEPDVTDLQPFFDALRLQAQAGGGAP